MKDHAFVFVILGVLLVLSNLTIANAQDSNRPDRVLRVPVIRYDTCPGAPNYPMGKELVVNTTAQAMPGPTHLLTEPRETANFEASFPIPVLWRLEVKPQLSGWNIPVMVRVPE